MNVSNDFCIDISGAFCYINGLNEDYTITLYVCNKILYDFFNDRTAYINNVNIPMHYILFHYSDI